MQDFPELMGMGDVMRYLKVSRQYVDYLVESGQLRCSKRSTGKVFLRNDVVMFQRERERKEEHRRKRRQKAE